MPRAWASSASKSMTGLQRSPGRRRGSGLPQTRRGLFGDKRPSVVRRGSPGCGATATGRRTGRRPSCRPADRRVPRRECRSGVAAQDFGMFGCMAEHQVLGDELHVDGAAADVFHLPDVGGAELLLDPDAHFGHVAQHLVRVARAGQDSRTAASRRDASSGGPWITRARVRAMCSHVQASLS